MCWANTRRTAGNGDRRGRASQSRRDQGSFSCNSLRACLRTICWGACGPLAWQDADAGALSPVLRKGLPVCTYAKTPRREVAGEVFDERNPRFKRRRLRLWVPSFQGPPLQISSPA